MFAGITKRHVRVSHGKGKSEFNMAYTLLTPPDSVPRSGHRVLLIMGFLAPGAPWNATAKALANAGHEVLFHDNAGTGHSDSPPGVFRYTTSGLAEHASDLINKIWPSGPIHCVGYSMGGMIACHLVKQTLRVNPSRFASLTLVSTHPGGLRNLFPPWRGFKGTAVSILSASNLDVRTTAEIPLVVADSYVDKIHEDGRTGREIVKEYLAAFITVHQDPSTWTGIAQWLALATHRISEKDFEFIRSHLEGRLLVLTGDDDHLVRPANSDYIARVLKANHVRFQECGHGVHFTHHKEMAEEVHKLISKTDQQLASPTLTSPGSSGIDSVPTSDAENSPLLSHRV